MANSILKQMQQPVTQSNNSAISPQMLQQLQPSVAIAQDGEPIAGSTMLYTPAAVAVPGNISADVLVRVYQCCSTSTISVRNTGADTINIQDANIVVTRES